MLTLQDSLSRLTEWLTYVPTPVPLSIGQTLVLQVVTAINSTFVFCYVWALGGNLNGDSRDAFDEFVREQLSPVANFPGKPCSQGIRPFHSH